MVKKIKGSGRLINCKYYANKWKEEIKEKLSKLNKKPILVVFQIGEDKASKSYIKGIEKDCNELGIKFVISQLSQLPYKEIISEIHKVISCCGATAVMITTPLPYSKEETEAILSSIPVDMDIDCMNPNTKLYKPCTPMGIMKLFEMMGVNLEGKVVTVLGRSNTVGKPLANMLIDKGATVISCNSHTKDIDYWTLNCNTIISSVGKSNLLNIKNVQGYYPNDEKLIIDVGINRDENGKLCGDCDKELYDFVELITPVPNGISLMTRMALMDNIIGSVK